MANSWRAVAYGSWNSGSWVGEISTIGISGVGSSSLVPAGPLINEALPTFDAAGVGTTGTSTNMSWSFGSNGLFAWTEANQKAIGELLRTFLVAVKVIDATAFSWKEVRLSAIEADGSVVNGASVGTLTSPLAGSFTQSMPTQQAFVQTFTTGGRGAKNKGRMYLPARASTLTSNGMIDTGVPTVTNAAAKALVNGVNALSYVRAAVVSRTNQSYSDIISVRMGDEPDTMQSRRRRRAEVYTSLAL